MSALPTNPLEAEPASTVLPASVERDLPTIAKTELAKLSVSEQEAFLEEFKRRRKSTGATYGLWLINSHFAYLGRWGLQFAYWFTFGGLLVWAVIEAFKIPGRVKDHNKDVAIDVLRSQKAITSGSAS